MTISTQSEPREAVARNLPVGNGIKVAHVTSLDISLQLLLSNQLQSLTDEGYEIVGISAPGSYVAGLERQGVRHLPVSMTRRITPFSDLVSLWRLYRLFRKERFTIVHTHNPKPGLLGQLAAKLAGVPVIVNTVHGYYFHDQMHSMARRFYILLEKLAATCSDAILSQNRDDIRTALQERICKQEYIHHLGNGIDVETFDPARYSRADISRLKDDLQIDQDAPVVGFVGRLTHRKGFFDFLAAAEQILAKYPNARFLIVGTSDVGRSDSISVDEIMSRDLGDSCVLMGQRAYEELPLLYLAMDLLVLPSPFEGVPRAVMEAGAMQRPAVVTNVKGNRDVIRDGENGYLVPFAQPQLLANSIIRLLDDPQRATEMGRTAREMALEQFDERQVFAKVKDTYRRLLEEKHIATKQDSRIA